jgi:hypothetical protein
MCDRRRGSKMKGMSMVDLADWDRGSFCVLIPLQAVPPTRLSHSSLHVALFWTFGLGLAVIAVSHV